jgi:hypothetical protein
LATIWSYQRKLGNIERIPAGRGKSYRIVMDGIHGSQAYVDSLIPADYSLYPAGQPAKVPTVTVSTATGTGYLILTAAAGTPFTTAMIGSGVLIDSTTGPAFAIIVSLDGTHPTYICTLDRAVITAASATLTFLIPQNIRLFHADITPSGPGVFSVTLDYRPPVPTEYLLANPGKFMIEPFGMGHRHFNSTQKSNSLSAGHVTNDLTLWGSSIPSPYDGGGYVLDGKLYNTTVDSITTSQPYYEGLGGFDFRGFVDDTASGYGAFVLPFLTKCYSANSVALPNVSRILGTDPSGPSLIACNYPVAFCWYLAAAVLHNGSQVYVGQAPSGSYTGDATGYCIYQTTTPPAPAVWKYANAGSPYRVVDSDGTVISSSIVTAGYGDIGNMMLLKLEAKPWPYKTGLYYVRGRFIKPYLPLSHQTEVIHTVARIAVPGGDTAYVLTPTGAYTGTPLKAVLGLRTSRTRLASVSSYSLNGGNAGLCDFSVIDAAIIGW